MLYDEDMVTHIEFFVNTRYNKQYKVNSHVHKCYELVFYLEGEGTTTISSKTYKFKPGDFAVIRPGSVHDESSNHGTEVIFVGFTLTDVEISEGMYSNDTTNISELLLMINEEKGKQETYHKRMMDLLMERIVILLLRYPVNVKKEKTTIDSIVSFLKVNANKRLSVKDLAAEIGYSYDYFRQMFIEKYQMSAKDFIIKTRLENAQQYLINTVLSIDQIADMTGFSSSSHLCSVFKKEYGVSPKKYREIETKKNIGLNVLSDFEATFVDSYPGNLLKAVTFSFDDNTQFDRRLVKLLDKYNMVCTFNVNSGISHHDSKWVYEGVQIHRITKEEMQEIYLGHEVAAHSLTHPHLFDVGNEQLKLEIGQDVVNLQEWFPHQKILGMAYPYGQVDDRIIATLKKNRIKWGRTAGSSHNYELPKDKYRFTPTCHFRDENIDQIVDNFINMKPIKKQVLCIWGHSSELEVYQCWQQFEEILKKLANRHDIFYCTNSEAIL